MRGASTLRHFHCVYVLSPKEEYACLFAGGEVQGAVHWKKWATHCSLDTGRLSLEKMFCPIVILPLVSHSIC